MNVSCRLLSHIMQTEETYDAIIIGAGISGIATAKTFIADHGFNTLVIEKYDSVGGGCVQCLGYR